MPFTRRVHNGTTLRVEAGIAKVSAQKAPIIYQCTQCPYNSEKKDGLKRHESVHKAGGRVQLRRRMGRRWGLWQFEDVFEWWQFEDVLHSTTNIEDENEKAVLWSDLINST